MQLNFEMCNFICAIAMLTFVVVSGQYFNAARQVSMPADEKQANNLNMVGRQQRSLYEGTWHKHDLGIAPIGVGHITKDELIALLEAWTEVESELKPKPAEETVPDMVAESQEEDEEQDEKVTEDNVEVEKEVVDPLTVSLPAFVPIQLTAMYTPPTQASAAQNIGVAAGAVVAGGGAEAHTKSLSSLLQLTSRSRLPSSPIVPAPIPKPQVFKTIKPKVKAFLTSPIKPPKTSFLRSARPLNPQPARIVPPPPPFLAHPPAPLELVPSTQLWSHWQ